MTQDNGMDPDSLCETCQRADRSCPSYPAPVDHCRQYEPSQHATADRWWDNLNDRNVVYDD